MFTKTKNIKDKYFIKISRRAIKELNFIPVGVEKGGNGGKW